MAAVIIVLTMSLFPGRGGNAEPRAGALVAAGSHSFGREPGAGGVVGRSADLDADLDAGFGAGGGPGGGRHSGHAAGPVGVRVREPGRGGNVARRTDAGPAQLAGVQLTAAVEVRRTVEVAVAFAVPVALAVPDAFGVPVGHAVEVTFAVAIAVCVGFLVVRLAESVIVGIPVDRDLLGCGVVARRLGARLLSAGLLGQACCESGLF